MMLFLMMFVYITPLFAQSKGDGALYYNDWVVSDSIPDDACDVKSKDMGLTKLAVECNATRMTVATVVNDNYIGYKGQEYVAREINRYGAKFCKTVIGGYRKNCHFMSYTRYFEPEVQDCFWLCKEGYYGESCMSTALTSVTPQIPMEQFLIKKPKDGVGALAPFGTSGDNIEEQIPMFRANEGIDCWDWKNRAGSSCDYTDHFEDLYSDDPEEHDMILAVQSIGSTDSKFQIKVQPLLLRAGASQYCSGNEAAWNAWPMMKFVGKPISVCPSDYKQEKNSDGTINCIDPEALSRQEKASVEALKADKLSHLCSSDGYQSSLFKDEIHNLVVVDKDTKQIKKEGEQPTLDDVYDWYDKNACAIYKCKSEGLAFKSDWKTSGDMGCYDCTGGTGRFGIDKLGVCIKCDDGQIFIDGECKVASTLSKTDMLYGMGKTSSTSLADMCWTETNPTLYKCCVSNNQIPGAAACNNK